MAPIYRWFASDISPHMVYRWFASGASPHTVYRWFALGVLPHTVYRWFASVASLHMVYRWFASGIPPPRTVCPLHRTRLWTNTTHLYQLISWCLIHSIKQRLTETGNEHLPGWKPALCSNRTVQATFFAGCTWFIICGCCSLIFIPSKTLISFKQILSYIKFSTKWNKL
jgi:hypothetical protein